MSKNVAVFVDVANIFYAAKAAGTDIDYVTLLKSATAGRDFVRAYAYTGLDPENENQRQFHSFLGRSGYKVVSKDIRKYGDGRIKANLDIELVVDLMRMATHLDIAVVVSGDGDFAPAIRAVQQMGVRVEVMSFRGNTSSDLIEVADVFTDITQVARVEKGERSGRRVAAAGDLSMTEVPDKQSEGPVRRRRTRRPDDREPAAAVASNGEGAAMSGNLIVLPGERLSRVPSADEDEPRVAAQGPELVAAQGPELSLAGDAAGELDADGRRRRRRRGGRGRGRTAREEAESRVVGEMAGQSVGEAQGEEPAEAATDIPAAGDVEDFADEAPVAAPQHSAFGSVWDTQLGVPAAQSVGGPSGGPAGSVGFSEDEYEDEPEVPEYLLAERRQQRGPRSGRPRTGGGGGRAGAYRTALDRERFGRSGTSAFGGGAGGGGMGGGGGAFPGGPRPPDRSRAPRQGGQRDPRWSPRPERPPYREPTPQAPRSVDAEPWSEVPAEVAELLRAEMSRRGRPTEDLATAPAERTDESPLDAPSSEVPEVVETARPRSARTSRAAVAPRRSRAVRAATEDASPGEDAPVATSEQVANTEQGGTEPVEAAAPRRRRSTRSPAATAVPKATSAPEATSDPDAAAEAPAPSDSEPVAPARRRSTRRAPMTASGEETPAQTTDGSAASAKPATTTRRRTTRRPAASSESDPEATGTGADEAP